MAVLWLVAAGLGAPLLAAPANAFGEHVFQANPVVGLGDPYYGVYSGATLAQSILVSRDYVLANVTLRVRNDGSSMNPLVVSIRSDDPTRHVPVMTGPLASTSQVSPNNPPEPTNWSFPFSPSPLLRADTVYWIVAQNTAPQAPPTNGYEWHHSNADTYSAGSAYVLDPVSGIWTGLPYDLHFITYGREWDTNVTVAMTASQTRALSGDTVTFTVDFNNTGAQAAPRVWVNTTVPAALVNVSLGFPGIQPVSAAAFPNLTFLNVANGPHAFALAGQIDLATPPGSLATVRAAIDFQNATGVVSRGRQAAASVLVGLVTKQLYLGGTSVATKLLTTAAPTSGTAATSTLTPGAAQPVQFLLSPALARPFQALDVTATLWISTQKAPPQNYRLNVSLLDNGTAIAWLNPSFTLTTPGFHARTFSFGAVDHGFGYGHQIGLSVWSFGGGSGSTDNLLLDYNSTALPSRLDLLTPTYVAIDDLAVTNPETNGTVWSPLDPIVTHANVSDPFGRTKIKGVWINISDPTGTVVAAGSMQALAQDASGLPSWILFDYTLSPPLLTGEYRIDVRAMEDNGVVDLARSDADVAAPVFSLEDVTSVGRAQAGGAYAYYLYYNNSGTGPAGTVWINETLPPELTYLTSSIAYTSVAGSTYTWVLAGVPVGNYRLEIDVRVLGSSTVPAWIQDGATLAYTDSSGHDEPPVSASAIVFLNGPVLGLTLGVVPTAGLHVNETAVYTIGLHNTGADSGTFWVNDTVSSDFTYASDTAASIGGSLTRVGSRLLYQFPGIPAGANWAFQVTARAGAALGRNATYLNLVDVNYTSTNGYLMPREAASAASLALSPWFSEAEITFVVPQIRPGQHAPAVIRLRNDGNEPSPDAWLNLTVDSRLTIDNATAPFSAGAGTAQFALKDVAIGLTSIYLNVTVSPTAVDGSILQMKGGLDAKDGYGNSLPSLPVTRTFVLVSAADLAASAAPSAPRIEAGTTVPLTVTVNNFGTGDASRAWLNVTVPSTLLYANDTSGVTPSILGSVYSYYWPTASPVLLAGGRSVFTFSVRARATTPNGTAADIGFRLEYQDLDQISRAASEVILHATIVAPALVLRVEASASGVMSGGTFNYTLRVTNQGMTLAHLVSLEDDVDPRLSVVLFTSSVPGEGAQNLTWNFTDLGPGQTETINLTIRAADGLPAGAEIPNSIEASYTNSAGLVLASIRSLPVTIHIEQDLMPILWIAGVAGLFGAIVIGLLMRREHVEIEEVFLVYRDGVLISHLSRTLLREKDEDVLSGMLTAVQEFVREAFQYGEHRELHQLDFGDYRILIERGKFVYLAVVYSGQESPSIHKKVRTVIDLIEKQFGSVLEKWDGDMEEVVGARDVIRDTLLGSNNHNHVAAPLPEYE